MRLFPLFLLAACGSPDPAPADGTTPDDVGTSPTEATETSSTTSSTTLPELPSCADECLFGETGPLGTCELWDDAAQDWVELGDGTTSLHNRARLMETWINPDMRPYGGFAENTRYTDSTLTEVASWHGMGDSSIWTGTYLAAESLRAISTGSADAEARVNDLVYVLHDYFNVTGNPGYLARFPAPVGADPRLDAIFPADGEAHFTAEYKGQTWNYLGGISRDQYQGVMLGYSLAYEATSDPEVQALIREDVVELVEELMLERSVVFHIRSEDGTIDLSPTIDVQYVVLTDDETATGEPEFTFDFADFEESAATAGFQEFHPRFYNMVTDQIPLLGWVPEIPRSGSAIMLASFFQVALQVTDGVPEYATRRQAILEHYEDNFDGWWDIAENPLGYVADSCMGSYYGRNIRFHPMYNLARLETDPARSTRIGANVLQGIMWPDVETHKNVWFAYIYAANHPSPTSVQSVVDDHTAQLEQFRSPPLLRIPQDLTGQFPEDPNCPGNAVDAIDVSIRATDGFMWQRNPFQLAHIGDPQMATGGVDYLAAYWLGRRHGFIDDDTPDQCLKWRP